MIRKATLALVLSAACGGQATPQVLADHPAGYWRLGEPSGTSAAADASGNGNVGRYEIGVQLGQPGAVSARDTAAAFYGSAAVVVPDASSLNLTSALTVEAWVRPTATSENGGIFEKTIGGAVNTQFSLLVEGGAAKFRVRPAGSSSPVTVAGPALPLGLWSHVAGTFDGSALHLYVNGELVGSGAATTLAGGSGQSLIGRLGSGLYSFQGTLDEVALFAEALPAERIRAHYLEGASAR